MIWKNTLEKFEIKNTNRFDEWFKVGEMCFEVINFFKPKKPIEQNWKWKVLANLQQ